MSILGRNQILPAFCIKQFANCKLYFYYTNLEYNNMFLQGLYQILGLRLDPEDRVWMVGGG